MQNFTNIIHQKRGYVAIIICTFVPLITLATKLCLAKSDIDVEEIKKNFKFVECFMTVSTNAPSNAILHINDNSANPFFQIKDNPTKSNSGNILNIHTKNKAYITLKVSANKATGKMTFKNLCNHAISSNFFNKENPVEAPGTKFTFIMGSLFGISFDKISFTSQNVKIDDATVENQCIDFNGSAEMTGGCIVNNYVSMENKKFYISGGQDTYCIYPDWQNLKDCEIIDTWVDAPYLLNGEPCDGGAHDVPNITINPNNTNKEKIITLRKATEGTTFVEWFSLKNNKILKIGEGITLLFDKPNDPFNSNGKISFYGGSYCGSPCNYNCTLTLEVSPAQQLRYIRYKNKDNEDQTISIPSGETQTIVISPSTHRYEPDSGGYKIELELDGVEVVSDPYCPQVYR